MSPRPKKPRNCCKHRRPHDHIFKPAGAPMSELEKVNINHDELEAVRLCDIEDMTQAEAGEAMGVSRGTVQRLVCSARKKISTAILHGQALVIDLDD